MDRRVIAKLVASGSGLLPVGGSGAQIVRRQIERDLRPVSARTGKSLIELRLARIVEAQTDRRALSFGPRERCGGRSVERVSNVPAPIGSATTATARVSQANGAFIGQLE